MDHNSGRVAQKCGRQKTLYRTITEAVEADRLHLKISRDCGIEEKLLNLDRPGKANQV